MMTVSVVNTATTVDKIKCPLFTRKAFIEEERKDETGCNVKALIRRNNTVFMFNIKLQMHLLRYATTSANKQRKANTLW